MKCAFLLFPFFVCSNLFGQIKYETEKQAITKQFKQFISTGLTVVDTATSDFNKDGLTNLVLLTENRPVVNNSKHYL